MGGFAAFRKNSRGLTRGISGHGVGLLVRGSRPARRRGRWAGASRCSFPVAAIGDSHVLCETPASPFTAETAARKVRLAEDAWNSRDPQLVSLGYSAESVWRNRAEFIAGRAAIVEFLGRKWTRELDYRLIKELWAFTENRIAVRFAYEWHDDAGSWFRSYGNENWEFGEDGLMRRRLACINDLPIAEADRRHFWSLGPRDANHPGLSELGL